MGQWYLALQRIKVADGDVMKGDRVYVIRDGVTIVEYDLDSMNGYMVFWAVQGRNRHNYVYTLPVDYERDIYKNRKIAEMELKLRRN